MNNMPISDKSSYFTGFIDSGTTFTYFPRKIWNNIDYYFKDYCSRSEAHCAGKPTGKKICFEYSEEEFPEGPLEFFKTYPVLTFLLDAGEEKDPVEFHWYPSEYLYRDTLKTYCLAAESYYNPYQIMIGGTFMR